MINQFPSLPSLPQSSSRLCETGSTAKPANAAMRLMTALPGPVFCVQGGDAKVGANTVQLGWFDGPMKYYTYEL